MDYIDYNLIELSGIIAGVIEKKYSPAGIFQAKFWLNHESWQNNKYKNSQQKVKCSIQIVMIGEKMVGIINKMFPGQKVIISGYINERNINSKESWLVIHAQKIKLLETLEI